MHIFIFQKYFTFLYLIFDLQRTYFDSQDIRLEGPCFEPNSTIFSAFITTIHSSLHISPSHSSGPKPHCLPFGEMKIGHPAQIVPNRFNFLWRSAPCTSSHSTSPARPKSVHADLPLMTRRVISHTHNASTKSPARYPRIIDRDELTESFSTQSRCTEPNGSHGVGAPCEHVR